jgi:ABC-type amino acid transport substrate-binding protein
MTAALRALLCIALAALALPAAAEHKPPAKVRVVSDGNYPPYLFRDADGQLSGVIRDKWELWSRTTGVPVELRGVEWTEAQDQVRSGEADVIDAFSYTEARAREYSFGSGRGQVEARLFFHNTLGGIHDIASLRGIAVGAKAGSACGEWLRGHGVQFLRTYSDSLNCSCTPCDVSR